MRKRKRIFLLSAAFLCIFLMTGCGKVSTKSPEAVVKSMLQAYQEKDQDSVLACMGLNPDKKCEDAVQDEIDYNMKIFEAHEAEKIGVEKSGVLGETKGNQLVYTWYYYETKNKKKTFQAPAMSFYFVKEKDKKYYVIPAKDVTDEMSEYSRTEYEKFTQSEEYKKYRKSYKEFTRENPKYESNLEISYQELTEKKEK